MRKSAVIIIAAVLLAPAGLAQDGGQQAGPGETNSTEKGFIGSTVDSITSTIYSFLVEFTADVVEEVMGRKS